MDKQPLISRQISARTRVYYFDVLKDKKGKPYVSVSEIPTGDASGKKKRQRIFIHKENVDKFAEAFADVSQFLKDEAKR